MTNTSHKKVYWVVFTWLVVLTIFEVLVTKIGLPHFYVAALLIGSSLGKAILIVLFFMHLKFEGPLVWLLPGIPLLFAVLFVLGLFPDMVYHAVLKL